MSSDRQSSGAAGRGALRASLALLAVVVAPASDFASGADGPELDLARGFEVAAAAELPVLVRVEADWCELCEQMERTTYRDPDALTQTRRFVTVRVDAGADGSLARRYNLEVLPVALVLDDRGREITRMTGVVAPQPFVEKLDAVWSGYSGYLTDRRLRRDAGALTRVADYLARAGNPEAAARNYKRALKRLDPGDSRRRTQLQNTLTQLRMAQKR